MTALFLFVFENLVKLAEFLLEVGLFTKSTVGADDVGLSEFVEKGKGGVDELGSFFFVAGSNSGLSLLDSGAGFGLGGAVAFVVPSTDL